MNLPRRTSMLGTLACCLVGGWIPIPAAFAQSEESEPAPLPGQFEAEPLPPPDQPFFIPDVPHSLVEKSQVRERWITLKVGLVVLGDYTAFEQDRASVGQVATKRTSGKPGRCG